MKAMLGWFGRILDYPMLHTRIMSYTGILFFILQLDKLREKDSTTLIAQALAQGYQWGLLIIIGLYIAPKFAEKVGDAIINFKFGSAGATAEKDTK
jgi:hypothetical protein